NVTGEETITICEAALPYTWNGQTITTAGDHTATLTSAAGCDSVVTLHLFVDANVTGEETVTICAPQLPYTWNGQTITAAGDYSATLINAAGCDSIATLHLEVDDAIVPVFAAIGPLCLNATAPELPLTSTNGITGRWNPATIITTTAGTTTYTFTPDEGQCAGETTLGITINASVEGEEAITICEGQLPYTWNGQEITTAGDHTATLTSSAGCDSVVTLHLFVDANVTGEETITICEGQLP